jgi:hypothetical protein
MFLLLKYRDHMVELPVDREQLLRIPAFGLQPLSYKDGCLCFPSWTETKPIEQATRQAISNIKLVSQWLTKAIGQTIPNKEFSSPVLVFPGWQVISRNFQQLNAATLPVICNKALNHKQLVKTMPALRSNKEVTQALSQQQVDAIVYQVAQRCLSKSEVGKGCI